MNEIIFSTDKETFEKDVIEQSKEKPVVVDFWASWCAPCTLLSPIIEKVAKEFGGKILLAKVDVQANQELAVKYGIMSIPNVKMFKNGQIVDEFVGLRPEGFVREWMKKHIE
ncbi:MAG: thioredoxin [Candidatus Aenigmarchaeota archaeon]|nr:thioredoxin [Candidatus Aenigmarchaeota archaeon]